MALHATRGLLLTLLALAGCAGTATEAVTWPRTALELPDEIRQRYEIPGPIREVTSTGTPSPDTFALECEGMSVKVHRVVPEGPGPHATVVLLPILAGGGVLMEWCAAGLADRGYAAIWADRLGPAMRAGQRAQDLEDLFRRTVIQTRIVIEWARHRPEVDPQRIGILGLSTGGIVGGVVLATEPTLAGGVLCLAGGDLPDLLLRSAERRIVTWRRWRSRHDGLSGDPLRQALRREMTSDPALLGPYVPAEKVLLVGADADQVVPTRHQDILWEALGRPRRIRLPLSHYTAALALSPVLSETGNFLASRFSTVPPPTAKPGG